MTQNMLIGDLSFTKYKIFAAPAFEVGLAGVPGHLALQNLEGGALGVLHAAALDDASLQDLRRGFTKLIQGAESRNLGSIISWDQFNF